MASYHWKNPKIACGIERSIAYAAGEAASMSYKLSELIYLNAGAVTNYASSGSKIAGIVQKDASGTTSTVSPYMPIYPADLLLVFCTLDGTDALADTATANLMYDSYVASNTHYLDTNVDDAHTFIFQSPLYDVNGTSTNYAYCTIVSTVLDPFVGT